MKLRFINEVIKECLAYANRYSCSFEDALEDWEGDGPNGSWGLTPDERAAIIEAHESTTEGA